MTIQCGGGKYKLKKEERDKNYSEIIVALASIKSDVCSADYTLKDFENKNDDKILQAMGFEEVCLWEDSILKHIEEIKDKLNDLITTYNHIIDEK